MILTLGRLFKLFSVDLDDLGGYANGPNLTDRVVDSTALLSTTPTGNVSLGDGNVSGGLASYPAEGGYIYVIKNRGTMVAYKYGFSQVDGSLEWTYAGRANFSAVQAASTPSVTSLHGMATLSFLFTDFQEFSFAGCRTC